jgi:eukaryotic-like serine/threonine-protein kinase
MTVVPDDLTATYRSGSDGAASGFADVAVTGSCFGRFVTNGLLGQGGMGIVLSAFDPELDRQVAIKVLVPGSPAGSGGDAEAARAQLQREAQAMAKLNHPNVVTVYDVGRAGEHLFIAMELVQGGTLRQWLEAQTRSWREILTMFVAAGRGLEAAHVAGLVHRDFKPENVLLGSDGRPRVSDFGLVTASGALEGSDLEVPLSESSVAVRGVSFGTPAYMSPEQWSGGVIDARGDQFAFCVALWKALMGSHPFAGTTAKELRASVLSGARPAAPGGRRAPSWLTQILLRWPGSFSSPRSRICVSHAGTRRPPGAAGRAPESTEARSSLAVVPANGRVPISAFHSATQNAN